MHYEPYHFSPLQTLTTARWMRHEHTDTFNGWLYGERKNVEAIPVNLMTSISCHLCHDTAMTAPSLLDVQDNLFHRRIQSFSIEKLSLCQTFLEEDFRECTRKIVAQFETYKQTLLKYLKMKKSQEHQRHEYVTI
ncbi:unnamed protein product [Didymodactylos carnosus]|uniref:Uncharacterized protein n=1 Tax=Didymodactylos carnosus TaxID=1234261 RepID=A0A814PNX5_9BILA|nr:unnamed protein product [Didymodactylos carnosus]CAF3873237.1 unnamed protein product [Didymodactylos carnosus]